MKKVNWDEGVKTIPDDMNAVHDLTETAFGEFMKGLSGGLDTMLFNDAPPVVTRLTPTIFVDIPTQRFAVSGLTEVINTTIVTFPDTPTAQHRVFFVISRSDINANRDVIRNNGGTLEVVSLSSVVRIDDGSRIEKTSSASHLTPAPAPTLGPNDVGYVELVTVIWDGATLTDIPNTTDLYSFPGASVSAGIHGNTHMPGMTDPIPVAAVSGAPEGSDPGLMPAGAFATLKGAIQNLTVATSSPYLIRVINGDNTPLSPKRVELTFNHDTGSFKVTDVSGTSYLSLNFPSGPLAGTSLQPASATHRHSASESPTAMESTFVDVTGSDLGDLLTIPAFQSVNQIVQTQVFWSPPGLNAPLIACDKMLLPSGGGYLETGSAAHIISSDEVKVETSSGGFVSFSAATLTYILSITGSITWTSAEGGRVAKSGRLTVRVIGER